jgi:hypothetical protein
MYIQRNDDGYYMVLNDDYTIREKIHVLGNVNSAKLLIQN